jgi:hypothetical protein
MADGVNQQLLAHNANGRSLRLTLLAEDSSQTEDDFS